MTNVSGGPHGPIMGPSIHFEQPNAKAPIPDGFIISAADQEYKNANTRAIFRLKLSNPLRIYINSPPDSGIKVPNSAKQRAPLIETKLIYKIFGNQINKT